MAEVRNPSEPSMEEILASIRRIIVEDNGPLPGAQAGQRDARPATAAGREGVTSTAASRPVAPGQGARVAGSEGGVRPYPAPPPNFAPPPQTPRSPPVQEAILDLTERIDEEDLVHRTAEIAPPQPLPSASAGRLSRPPPLKPTSTPESRLASDETLASSVANLTKLAGIGQAVRQPELPLGDVGRTLEEMVRELLRPHLKEWLDANLPRLVERLVRDEINRLVREVQER